MKRKKTRKESTGVSRLWMAPTAVPNLWSSFSQESQDHNYWTVRVGSDDKFGLWFRNDQVKWCGRRTNSRGESRQAQTTLQCILRFPIIAQTCLQYTWRFLDMIVFDLLQIWIAETSDFFTDTVFDSLFSWWISCQKYDLKLFVNS